MKIKKTGKPSRSIRSAISFDIQTEYNTGKLQIKDLAERYKVSVYYIRDILAQTSLKPISEKNYDYNQERMGFPEEQNLNTIHTADIRRNNYLYDKSNAFIMRVIRGELADLRVRKAQERKGKSIIPSIFWEKFVNSKLVRKNNY